ncbi:hypothetical protein BDQ17DRAFT_239969 [Cyathus striatus]|nr:hypothetical protein BDQ17DRAFT_239969 [Cyathus striatus]
MHAFYFFIWFYLFLILWSDTHNHTTFNRSDTLCIVLLLLASCFPAFLLSIFALLIFFCILLLHSCTMIPFCLPFRRENNELIMTLLLPFHIHLLSSYEYTRKHRIRIRMPFPKRVARLSSRP